MKNLWKMRANTILVLSRERNEMKRKLLSLLLSVVVLIGFSITVLQIMILLTIKHNQWNIMRMAVVLLLL